MCRPSLTVLSSTKRSMPNHIPVTGRTTVQQPLGERHSHWRYSHVDILSAHDYHNKRHGTQTSETTMIEWILKCLWRGTAYQGVGLPTAQILQTAERIFKRVTHAHTQAHLNSKMQHTHTHKRTHHETQELRHAHTSHAHPRTQTTMSAHTTTAHTNTYAHNHTHIHTHKR